MCSLVTNIVPASFNDHRFSFEVLSYFTQNEYPGLSPVTERSGQKSWVHWRWQCSKFVRQSFIEWASKSVGQSYWAGIYYAQQKAKGNSH